MNPPPLDYRLQVISQTLHDLYTMDDDHQRPAFVILAEWQERASAYVRASHSVHVQDDFGGCHTFRFQQDGRVFISEHATWQQVATTRPENAAT